MKISCEYCGSQIDITKSNVCPNCGASYANNISYKNIKEHEMKEKELDLEGKRIAHENAKGVTKILNSFSKVFIASFFIPIIIIIIVFVVGVFIVTKGQRVVNSSSNKVIDTIINSNIDSADVEKAVTVSLNEFAETSNYKVKVDSYEVIEDYPFKPTEGYQVVTFHFIVENVSGVRYNLYDSINCVVDGIAQSSKHDFDRDSLPYFIEKDLTVHGYKAFEVPINALSYDIKFGNYVTIHIEL